MIEDSGACRERMIISPREGGGNISSLDPELVSSFLEEGGYRIYSEVTPEI